MAIQDWSVHRRKIRLDRSERFEYEPSRSRRTAYA